MNYQVTELSRLCHLREELTTQGKRCLDKEMLSDTELCLQLRDLVTDMIGDVFSEIIEARTDQEEVS